MKGLDCALCRLAVLMAMGAALSGCVGPPGRIHIINRTGDPLAVEIAEGMVHP